MKFIPDEKSVADVTAPYYEDAAKGQVGQGIKGLSSTKSHRTLKSEIGKAFSRIGGEVTSYESGKLSGSPIRYAWRIAFTINEAQGEMTLAGLPLRKDTPKKRKQVLAHALYSFRDSIEAQYNLTLMNPQHIPFMGYLLYEGETLMDRLRGNALPMLSSSAAEFVDGEILEED